MIAAAIGLLCTVLPFVFKLIERRWEQDTPQKRRERELDSINQAIGTGDSVAVNDRLERVLDRLQNPPPRPTRDAPSQQG